MKTFEALTYTEKEEITALFSTWLNCYTHTVIVAVMERREEIINNEFAMNLLRELHDRQKVEENEFTGDIRMLFQDYDTFKQYDPHNHPCTHSGSYRDILYDMYIKNI